jgi:small subunit ribosomal protein S17
MKRQLQGIVMSNKMAKTIVVKVERIKQHPKYLRRYKVQAKFKVHDPEQKAKIGDVVVFEECRPLSKGKRWQLVEIIKTNQ